jgi:hypothetical protein
LDQGLIAQMAAAGALGVEDLLRPFAGLMDVLEELVAPARLARIRDWREGYWTLMRSAAAEGEKADTALPFGNSWLALVPLFFEAVSALLEEVKRDSANYYVSLLSGVLEQRGAALLRSRFQGRLLETARAQQVPLPSVVVAALPATCSLLLPLLHPQLRDSDALSTSAAALVLPCSPAELRAAGGLGTDAMEQLQALAVAPLPPTDAAPAFPTPGVPASLARVAAVALVVRTLQLPMRLESPQALQALPELLRWDGPRLAKIRDGIDVLALQATFAVVLRQTLPRLSRTGTLAFGPDELLELAHRLDVLLRDGQLGLTSLLAEVAAFVKRKALSVAQPPQPVSPQPVPLTAKSISTAILPVPPPVSPNAGAPALVQGWQAVLESSLRAAVEPSSHVLQLFMKRAFSLVLQGALDRPLAPLLAQQSLGGAYYARLAEDLSGQASAVATLLAAVHAPTLQTLLTAPLQEPAQRTNAPTAAA